MTVEAREVGYCYVQGSCGQKYTHLRSFTITLDEITYTIPPENLVYDHFGFCFINLMYDEALGDEIWIGSPFIETYSMFIDYGNNEVLFSQNVRAKSGA